MTRKYHNHRQQTNPRHREEETQNIDRYNIFEVKQPALLPQNHTTKQGPQIKHNSK